TMSALLYRRGMTVEEKRAWIMGAVSVITYTVYVIVIVGRLLSTPVAEVSYVAALLWTVGISIVTTIVLHIAVSIASGKDADQRDQRDREIGLFGEHAGHWAVVLGGVA